MAGILFRDQTSNDAHTGHVGKLEEVEQRKIQVRSSHDDQPRFPPDEHAGDAEEHLAGRVQQIRDDVHHRGPAGAVHQRQERLQESRGHERKEFRGHRRHADLRVLFAIFPRSGLNASDDRVSRGQKRAPRGSLNASSSRNDHDRTRAKTRRESRKTLQLERLSRIASQTLHKLHDTSKQTILEEKKLSIELARGGGKKLLIAFHDGEA